MRTAVFVGLTLSAAGSCGPARPQRLDAPAPRIHVETEAAAIDAPAGWSVSIHTPRSPGRNPVVWLFPPSTGQDRGAMVVVTASDASASDDRDPTAFLTSVLAQPGDTARPVVQQLDVDQVTVTCVELITPKTAAGACGGYRALGEGRRALVWSFVQAVEPALYRRIGGAPFLAECAVSLQGFEVIASPYAPATPSP